MTEAAGLLLAAGGSSRLGRCKQLLAIDGEPLVAYQARKLLAVSDDVVVVTGADGDAVGAALASLPLRVYRHAGWEDGLGSSIAAGVAALGDGANAALLLLCDQYRVEASALASLLQAWREDTDRVMAARWEEFSGPPVVFPRACFDSLRRLRGAAGARSVIAGSTAPGFLPLPEAGIDLDTPADLEEFRRYASSAPTRNVRRNR